MNFMLAIIFVSTCLVQEPVKQCTECAQVTKESNFVKIESHSQVIYKKMPTPWIKVTKTTENSN